MKKPLLLLLPALGLLACGPVDSSSGSLPPEPSETTPSETKTPSTSDSVETDPSSNSNSEESKTPSSSETTPEPAEPTEFTPSIDKEEVFVNGSAVITVDIDPAKASLVKYASATPNILSVDNAGKVTALAPGEGKIDISIEGEEDNVKSLTLAVLNHIQLEGYSQNFTYEDGVFHSLAIEATADNPHAYAMFATKGSVYYAEATIAIINSSNDGWARVGIGSVLDDTDGNGRAFFFSPKEGQKSVMMDVPNGWGATTANTMIWQVNGLSAIDASSFKLGMLRNGNDYYYTINDKLCWFESTNRFADKETYPAIIAKDTEVTASKLSMTTDKAEIDAKLASSEYQKKLFNAANPGFVNFESDAKFSFLMKDDGNAFFNNNSVRAYGEKGLLTGDFQVDFDISGIVPQADNDDNNRIGVGLRRVGTDPAKVDSFTVSSDVDLQAYDYRNWDWNGHTFWNGADKTQTTSDKPTREGHYRLTRTIEGEAASFALYHEDMATPVLEKSVPYVGDYIVCFGSNYTNGTIENASWSNK